MATKPGPGSPYVPSEDSRRALQAALARPEPLRDVAVTLTIGGGLPEDRYALRFESRGASDVKCGLATPGARGRMQLQALQFSDDEAADVRRRLTELLKADLPVPRIPPDSLVGRLDISVGTERVTIYFMADPGQARDAGHPPPPPLTRTLEAIYAVCARGLGKRWKAP